LRLFVVDLFSDPPIAGYAGIDFNALVAHGLAAFIRRERATLSVTDDCRGTVSDARQHSATIKVSKLLWPLKFRRAKATRSYETLSLAP
jgi:hypothetical protein